MADEDIGFESRFMHYKRCTFPIPKSIIPAHKVAGRMEIFKMVCYIVGRATKKRFTVFFGARDAEGMDE